MTKVNDPNYKHVHEYGSDNSYSKDHCLCYYQISYQPFMAYTITNYYLAASRGNF